MERLLTDASIDGKGLGNNISPVVALRTAVDSLMGHLNSLHPNLNDNPNEVHRRLVIYGEEEGDETSVNITKHSPRSDWLNKLLKQKDLNPHVQIDFAWFRPNTELVCHESYVMTSDDTVKVTNWNSVSGEYSEITDNVTYYRKDSPATETDIDDAIIRLGQAPYVVEDLTQYEIDRKREIAAQISLVLFGMVTS